MLSFIQIDWGDLCSSVEKVNFGTTVEEGVDWGITLDSGKKVNASADISDCYVKKMSSVFTLAVI